MTDSSVDPTMPQPLNERKFPLKSSVNFFSTCTSMFSSLRENPK